MPIERRANIIGPTAAHVLLSAQMPRVYAMTSFADNKSPKTQREMRQLLREHPARFHTETTAVRFTPRGHDYALLIFSTAEERSACFAVLRGDG